jgi:hypothetical protein
MPMTREEELDQAVAAVTDEHVEVGDRLIDQGYTFNLIWKTMLELVFRATVLIELNGEDLRRDPLQVRKATLASILAKPRPGIRFNEHIEGDGPTVFAHACKMGLEGIVSKRKDSAYRSGRSPDWLKMKNPACAAVTREAEEDWAR